jgi:hypothetical protein
VSRSLAFAGLLVLAALLGLTLAAEFGLGVGDGADAAEPAMQRHAAEKAAATTVPRVAATPAAELAAAIMARPLFAPNRRPPAEVKTSATAAPAQSDTLPRLSGIIMDRDTRLAIFQPKDASKPLVLGEGGEVAGLKIAAIAPFEVIMSGPKGEQHLYPTPDPTLLAAPMDMPEPAGIPQPDPRRRGLRPGVNFRQPGTRFQPGRANAMPTREMRARRGHGAAQNMPQPVGGPDR